MKSIISIIVIILLCLLFVGGPGDSNSRIMRELWQSGHFVLFASLSFLLIKFSPLKKINLPKSFLIVTLFCLVLGAITEGLQILVGRNFEINDIINDVVGGYAGLLASRFQIKNALLKQTALCLGIFALTVMGAWSLFHAMVDEYDMKRDFPIMSDFETPLEFSRWHARRAKLSLSTEQTRHGKHAMKIKLLPRKKYSEFLLVHFISDWSHHTTLHFSLFNAEQNILNLTLKIYDLEHHYSNHEFSDRFNRKISVKPGWNDFHLPLEEIKFSPKERAMDMQNIRFLSFFSSNFKESKVIYLDHLHLD